MMAQRYWMGTVQMRYGTVGATAERYGTGDIPLPLPEANCL